MMDGIFGRRNFRNELVWCYAGGGVPKKDFPRKHDTILRYTKTDQYFFEPIYRPYSEGTQERGRTAVKGKYYEEGLRASGTPINDWWTDVSKITSPTDPEKIGYPTQKSEALLQRILAASSRRGDIVCDPFCGCGTTVAVAEKMGRKWIGVDISPSAIGVMKRRLEKIGAPPKIVGLPVTEGDLRHLKPFEFQNWVIQQVNGTPSPRRSGDMGVDGLSFMYHEPIQVKRSERVGRNVVDNFETAVKRSGKGVGYIVAFSFSKGAHEEAARARRAGEANIVLVTVSDLLNASEAMTRPGAPSPPTARKPTPELMRLLSAFERSLGERPLPPSRPKTARPAPEQLIESDQSPVS